MTFAEWVLDERKKRGKFSMRDAAKELRLNLSTAQRCLEPAENRTLELALYVQERTGGKVPAWTHLPLARRMEIYGPAGCPSKKKGGAA